MGVERGKKKELTGKKEMEEAIIQSNFEPNDNDFIESCVQP